MNERGRLGVTADGGEPGTENQLVLGAPENETRDPAASARPMRSTYNIIRYCGPNYPQLRCFGPRS